MEIFAEIGLEHVRSLAKCFLAETPLADYFFVRGHDVPRLVEDGLADAGITGYDCVIEHQADVQIVSRLGRRVSRIVLAVRSSSKFTRPEEIPPNTLVATEYPNITRRYFERMGTPARVLVVKGATEAYLHLEEVTCIVDLTTTGQTLLSNNLKELDELLVTEPCLIINRELVEYLDSDQVDPEQKNLIESIKAAGHDWHVRGNRRPTVFVAGIVQGVKQCGVHDQQYRSRIKQIIRQRFPHATIIDCEAMYPEGASFGEVEAKAALNSLAEQAAASDVVIAYLPSASMGTSIELWEARRAGKYVVTITPLAHNWAVMATSSEIVPDLDSLARLVNQGGLDTQLALSTV